MQSGGSPSPDQWPAIAKPTRRSLDVEENVASESWCCQVRGTRKVRERARDQAWRAMSEHDLFSVVASVTDANANVASGEAVIAMQS
jgi:hypothetical protein